MREFVHYDDGWAARLAPAGLADFEGVMAFDAGERLDKPGLEDWRQRWRVRLPDDPTGPTIYLKRFSRPPLRRQIERWREGHAGWSTARIEYENARLLAAAGVPGVAAIGVGERMSGIVEYASYILLSEVPGDALERWLPREITAGRRPWAGTAGARAVESLARIIARFHAAGLIHRDLYLAHIFIHDDGSGEPAFRLIDLQRVFRPRGRRRRWIVKDLAALAFSTPAQVGTTTRLRFLCRYVRAYPGAGTARDLGRRVGAKVSWMRRRAERVAARRR